MAAEGEVVVVEEEGEKKERPRTGSRPPSMLGNVRPASILLAGPIERPRAPTLESKKNSEKRRTVQQGKGRGRERGRPHGNAAPSHFGGIQCDMTVVQLANMKKQFVLENIIIKAQKKRMKEIEKDVATLKKEERGLGVKKAKARKVKLEMHLEKMTNLVVEETRAREQAQKDVAALTEEVAAFSQKYEGICHDVEALLSVKHRLEAEIEAKKREFEGMIMEQHRRLRNVEDELSGMDRLLFRDNLVRNKIAADKGMVEEFMDKLKDLLGKEEENIEADKEFLLKAIKEVKVTKPTREQRKRLSMMVMTPIGAGGSTSAYDGKKPAGKPQNPALLSVYGSRSTNRDSLSSYGGASIVRASIDQTRQSYKNKRESVMAKRESMMMTNRDSAVYTDKAPTFF